MPVRRRFIKLGLLSLLSACAAKSNRGKSSVSLTISVAASLQDVMQNLGKLYLQRMPQVNLNYNFGASGSLRYQIEQGAPVDVYISAAKQHMDGLDRQNLLLSNTRQNLLKNEIVLITARDNTSINQFDQLTSDRVSQVAIGAPQSVPAGKYAQEVLNFFQLYSALASKLIFAKNVRQVLAYVETGNVDAGIVYSTDAQISKRVRIAAVAPANSHDPVVYPVAVIQNSKQAVVAQDFVKFLTSDAAQMVFEAYGFINC